MDVFKLRLAQEDLIEGHVNDLSTKKCTTILLIVESALLVAAVVGIVFLALSGMALLATAAAFLAATIFGASAGFTIHPLVGACKREKAYLKKIRRVNRRVDTAKMAFVNSHIRPKDHFQNKVKFVSELDRRTAVYIKVTREKREKEAERQEYVHKYGKFARMMKKRNLLMLDVLYPGV